MRGWSRREVLAALAAAGAAPAWAGLLGTGCGAGAAGGARGRGAERARDAADLRAQLRMLVAELSPRFRGVRARAEIASSTRVAVDAAERGVIERRATGVVLSGHDGAQWIELGSQDISEEGVTALALALTARTAGPGASAARRPGRARTFTTAHGRDPRRAAPGDWLERAAKLHERAAAIGGSRIVYRAAALVVDDRDVIAVGDGVDVAERRVRARGSALFLAWTGVRLVAEEASRGAAAGLEAAEVPDGALAAAAEGALAHLSDSAPGAGEHELVLDPSVSALFLRHGVAPAMTGEGWDAPAAAAPITVRDDPTVAGAYGGYQVDDEGAPARSVTLVERGAPGGALGTGHLRRGGPLAEARPRPAHLVLEPGAETQESLVAGVKQGFLIEGGQSGGGDPRARRVGLRARRAKEIVDGRLTGRAYGPVQLAGGVAAMLAGVRAVAAAPALASWREVDDAEAATAVPVSASAPALVLRAWMGGAR